MSRQYGSGELSFVPSRHVRMRPVGSSWSCRQFHSSTQTVNDFDPRNYGFVSELINSIGLFELKSWETRKLFVINVKDRGIDGNVLEFDLTPRRLVFQQKAYLMRLLLPILAALVFIFPKFPQNAQAASPTVTYAIGPPSVPVYEQEPNNEVPLIDKL